MSRISRVLGRDMAVDLGTATTVVYARGEGVVLDEPSVVCVNTTSGEVLAVGEEAKMMEGRTPESVTVVRPLQEGVIAVTGFGWRGERMEVLEFDPLKQVWPAWTAEPQG